MQYTAYYVLCLSEQFVPWLLYSTALTHTVPKEIKHVYTHLKKKKKNVSQIIIFFAALTHSGVWPISIILTLERSGPYSTNLASYDVSMLWGSIAESCHRCPPSPPPLTSGARHCICVVVYQLYNQLEHRTLDAVGREAQVSFIEVYKYMHVLFNLLHLLFWPPV